MKYSVAAALLASATGAVAHGHHNGTVVTEVVSSYVTYCPEPTEITHGDKTYTVTEATTLTITDCPCTITKPVIPTSSVVCEDECPEVPTEVPEQPTYAPPPPHNNTTAAPAPTEPVPPPGGEPTTPAPPPPAPTAGAAKIAGLSGVAGLAGLAAFFL